MSEWQPIETAPKDGTEILWRSVRSDGKRTHAVIFWPCYEEAFKEGEWRLIPGDDDRLVLLKRAQKDIDDNPPYGSEWNRKYRSPTVNKPKT